MEKLKILCLHGYQQNKDIFRQKTGSFRKPFKKWIDFEFLDAPHLLRKSSADDPERKNNLTEDYFEEGRGWWLKNPQDDEADGFEESLALFEREVDKKGPFDAIMGFSQGAAFLGLMCILLQHKLAAIKFVILIAGFQSTMPAHEKYYTEGTKVNIPSLHVFGETDNIISLERSRKLMGLFSNPEELLHPGGHYVPMSRGLQDQYKKFLKHFITTMGE